MASAAEPIPAQRAVGTVRVKLPAKVAYNPDLLKKSVAELLDRIGCPKCFSGANCFFSHEREFIYEKALSPVLGDPNPRPSLTEAATISLSRGARYDINKVFKAIDKAIDIIGSCPCHSGIDVLYLNEAKVIGINEQIQGIQYGG